MKLLFESKQIRHILANVEIRMGKFQTMSIFTRIFFLKLNFKNIYHNKRNLQLKIFLIGQKIVIQILVLISCVPFLQLLPRERK